MDTQNESIEVKEQVLEPMHIAGLRMRGKYRECGQGFAQLGRKLGRHIHGKAFCLYYDAEYKEDDADFEACMPVKPGVSAEGIHVRELPGCRCVSLLHRGPYDTLGRSYEKVFAYINDKGYKAITPSREVYLKGPGMVFRGNPKNYLTEIQVPIEE